MFRKYSKHIFGLLTIDLPMIIYVRTHLRTLKLNQYEKQLIIEPIERYSIQCTITLHCYWVSEIPLLIYRTSGVY